MTFNDYLKSCITPFNIVAAMILAIGIPVIFYRLAFGLGPSTNLTDNNPWGIWIGFDMLCGVALAAGGFVIGTAVHLMGMKDYGFLVPTRGPHGIPRIPLRHYRLDVRLGAVLSNPLPHGGLLGRQFGAVPGRVACGAVPHVPILWNGVRPSGSGSAGVKLRRVFHRRYSRRHDFRRLFVHVGTSPHSVPSGC